MGKGSPDRETAASAMLLKRVPDTKYRAVKTVPLAVVDILTPPDLKLNAGSTPWMDR